MSGLTTAVRFSAILASRGSSHPLKHSPVTDVEQMLCQHSSLHVAEGQVQPRQSKSKQARLERSVKPGRVDAAFGLCESYQGPTVSVEEGESVAGGNGGTQEPGGDEPLPLSLANNTDNAEALQILIQVVLQRLWNDGISIIQR